MTEVVIRRVRKRPMNLELNSCCRSTIHDWEPRSRIVSMGLLLISIVTLQSLALAFLGLVISFGFLVLSRTSWKHVASNLRWPLLFFMPFLLVLPFTVEGETVASLCNLSASRQGSLLGFLIFLKGFAAVILAQVLQGSSPLSVTALALRDLGIPDSLVQIFLFTYRYIDLLGQELVSSFRSISARGFEWQSNSRTAKVYGNAFGVLLLRSLARSERMFFAMVSRGYNGHLPAIKARRMNLWDWVKALSVVVIALALQFPGVMGWSML
ncbi:MAG: cobalt ECF transporter T component CbiQ [Methanothrix sp.]|nr:cobalt ECF transporter T component CbiQ [Methanothrix sp.]